MSLSHVIVLVVIMVLLAGDIETNPGPIIMTDKPTVELLMNIFVPVPNWTLLVNLLPEIKYTDYVAIRETFKNDVVKQQQAFFTKWLSVCEYASWKEVVEVLKIRREHSLIQRIQELLEQHKTNSLPLASTTVKSVSTLSSIVTETPVPDAEQTFITKIYSPNSIEELFRSYSDKLVKSIVNNLYTVANALYAKNLIPEETKDKVYTVGIPDFVKSSELVTVIERQLQSSLNPEEYFKEVCYILAGHHTTLRNIISNMLQSIGVTLPKSVVVPTHHDDMKRYINTMSEKYKHQPIVPTDWPPRVGNNFFGRLALMEEKFKGQQSDKQSLWSVLRGKIDEIININYETISIEDIFKPCGRQPRIIIDGPPGIGKTTLCRKLLNMWANGKLKHKKFDLLLHCPLRNNKVSQATSLIDLFVCQYHGVQTVAEWFDKKNGAGLLILFDGWDELSAKHRDSSLVASIIRREKLPNCTVIVTSRSYASSSLLTLDINRHIQVIGFSESEITEVVKGTLLDPQLAEKLNKDLEVRSDVQSLCYVPLVCSMVILVYQKLGGHLPSTLTELYENFILQTIRRHAEKTHESIRARQLLSLHNLPNIFSLPLQEMCKLAYNSLTKDKDKMTFSSSDLPAEVAKEHYLGLISTIFEYDDEFSQFLHLSIQEFLAAWWMANYGNNTEEMFKKHFDNEHFRMSLRFVAGLTHLKPEHIYQDYFNKPLNLQCKRRPLFKFDVMHKSRFYQNHMIRSSGDHIEDDRFNNNAILLIQLLYESQNIDLCQVLASSIINSSLCFHRITLSLFDTLCLSYFIRNSNTKWNYLDLGEVSHQHQLIFNNQLAIECTAELEKVIEVKAIELTDDTVHDLLALPFLQNIQECYLNFFRGEYSPCYVLLKLLEMPSLKILHLATVSPNIKTESTDSEVYNLLAKFIKDNNTIQELNYEYSAGGDEVAKLIEAIIKGLTKNKTITSFSLAVSNSYDTNPLPTQLSEGIFEQLLEENHTLRVLKLTDNLLPSKMNIKRVNTPLEALEIGRDDIVKSLIPYVEGLHSLAIPLSLPVPSLFESHPCLEQLTIPLDNYSALLKIFDLLQKKQKLEAVRVIIKDGVNISEGWEDWSQNENDPLANITRLFEGTSDKLKCFELILPYENYLQTAALVGVLHVGFVKFHCLQELRLSLPLHSSAKQLLASVFIQISSYEDLVELQVSYVPEGDYDDSASIEHIQTTRFYEAGLSLIANRLLKIHPTLRLLGIDCNHINSKISMEPDWMEEVEKFFQAVFRHPTLEYISIPYPMKSIFELQKTKFQELHKYDKPFPIVEFL